MESYSLYNNKLLNMMPQIKIIRNNLFYEAYMESSASE
jgi:hypothetical protein